MKISATVFMLFWSQVLDLQQVFLCFQYSLTISSGLHWQMTNIDAWNAAFCQISPRDSFPLASLPLHLPPACAADLPPRAAFFRQAHFASPPRCAWGRGPSHPTPAAVPKIDVETEEGNIRARGSWRRQGEKGQQMLKSLGE